MSGYESNNFSSLSAIPTMTDFFIEKALEYPPAQGPISPPAGSWSKPAGTWENS